jgi:hypothetical protein
MEISILVEPVVGSGFRAISGSPLDLVAIAPTREEAIEKVQNLIQRRLSSGAEVVSVRIGDGHPLARHAGIFKDDPLVPAWKEAMRQSREQASSEP